MKKYLFLLIIPILFLLPKNVIAAEPITNISSYEFYWKALNTSNGVVDEDRVQLRPLQMLPMGISAQDYSLIRIGPLVNFQPLGYNSTYSADVLFYIETYTPFDIVDPFCGFWSNGGDKSSCTLNKVSEAQIDSRKTLVTYKASYNWTSSTGYAEFILNFGSTAIRPNETTFFYQINDFRGDVSEGQIIVDGLEETNKKLDEINDTLTSEEGPDNLDSLGDVAGWLPPGPVDSILNLPLTFFNSLTTSLNSTCSPVNVPLPYVNKNLTIPCISTLYEQIGILTFLNWVGYVVGAIILYNYFLHLYEWVDDTIQMKENSVTDWGGV